jgi:cytochrome c biogenesis protein CcmG/thiol:disulfide interchange protein DsbE
VKQRALGYAVAGGILIGVSILSAYLAHMRGGAVGGRANLEFTLKDMNGVDVRLADFKGKPLIVNFWATWCPPCILEQPELTELAAEYKDRGLTMVGISYNDEPAQIQEYAKEFKVPYPMLVGRDRDDVFDAFGLTAGLPTTVFIRADGTIATRLQGINTKAWLQEQIEDLVSQ